tara:strand:+ start:293 stop:691 length:399 start_codon:yes stop_codon:yes gene_type:complete
MKKNNEKIEIIKNEKKHSRILKVSELIKRTLAEIFLTENFTDKELQTFMLFVSEVTLSSDMRIAKVYISPFFKGDRVEDEKVLEILQRDLYKIKKKFSENLDLKFTPKLIFKIDKLPQNTQRLEGILNSIKK